MGQSGEDVYAMVAAWHGQSPVAALTQPGKPDGEVITGPRNYHASP